MNITVIGSGYVGLVTGACFAEFGAHVTCVDKDVRKIKVLKEGKVPFFEPGLEEMVQRNMKAGRLHFTDNVVDAIRNSLVIFIAVGTPPGENGSAEMKYVHSVAEVIGQNIDGYKVIVTKSTVPVGTGEKIAEIIRKNCKECNFDVVSNPEFLREGAAIEDFMRPNRIVIGVKNINGQAAAIMKDLYRPLYLIETPIIITDVETAELIKYASNAFLATKISFINEIANLCEVVGADVQTVAKGMGLDQRIGSKFLHAGPGYGGSCFPKDTLALAQIGKENNVDLKVVDATIRANEFQKEKSARLIIDKLGGARGATVAILGLSFKPNTDDVRDAPALFIIKMLIGAGAEVRVYDPEGMESAKAELPVSNITYCNDVQDTANGADAIVIVTEWNQFRNLDLKGLREKMKGKLFFDLRNIYEPEKAKKVGFEYYSIGR